MKMLLQIQHIHFEDHVVLVSSTAATASTYSAVPVCQVYHLVQARQQRIWSYYLCSLRWCQGKLSVRMVLVCMHNKQYAPVMAQSNLDLQSKLIELGMKRRVAEEMKDRKD